MNERRDADSVDDVRKAYKTRRQATSYALRGIDLQVRQGEFVAVLGKSGAGKSTLINMITGIDRPTGGEIRVGRNAIEKMSEDQIAALARAQRRRRVPVFPASSDADLRRERDDADGFCRPVRRGHGSAARARLHLLDRVGHRRARR